MKSLFKKGWFQVLVLGVVIGGLLIFLDNRYGIFGGKKENGEYHGTVSADKDKMYFTKAEYPEVNYDFGTVKEGDTVMHMFKVKNTGKEPLFIYKGVGSCECVRVFFNTAPIPVGGEEDIRVVFLTKGRKGKQQRTASIDTNTDPVEMTLALTGFVE